jgi:hypothetical protein
MIFWKTSNYLSVENTQLKKIYFFNVLPTSLFDHKYF